MVLTCQINMAYQPDSTGVFTDTANMIDHIGECTNLSVGYMFQHGKREWQDFPFLFDLRDALISLDPALLQLERQPGEDDFDWSYYEPRPGMGGTMAPPFEDSLDDVHYARLYSLVKEYPEAAADLLFDIGLSAEDMADKIYELTGAIPSTGWN